MLIDKAIEILSQDLTYTYPARFDDLQDAVKLGIEALKRLYLQREKPKRHFPTLLTGETHV